MLHVLFLPPKMAATLRACPVCDVSEKRLYYLHVNVCLINVQSAHYFTFSLISNDEVNQRTFWLICRLNCSLGMSWLTSN